MISKSIGREQTMKFNKIWNCFRDVNQYILKVEVIELRCIKIITLEVCTIKFQRKENKVFVCVRKYLNFIGYFSYLFIYPVYRKRRIKLFTWKNKDFAPCSFCCSVTCDSSFRVYDLEKWVINVVQHSLLTFFNSPVSLFD